MMDIPGVLVRSADTSLRDALMAIEEGRYSASVVVDSLGYVEGVLTDGDLRRMQLTGLSLTDPLPALESRTFIKASSEDSRDSIVELMRSLRISQVPILDDRGRLLGIHLFNDLIGPKDRPNVALILAGGLGSRLGDKAGGVPKPLVPVAGVPVVERMIHHLVGAGIRRIVMSVGFRKELIIDYFGDGEAFGCKLSYLEDPPDSPLGTGGPLLKLCEANREIRDPILVINGDLISRFDVEALLLDHESKEAEMTVVGKRLASQLPFGELRISAEGLLIEIVEKPTSVALVNAGIYVVQPHVVERLGICGKVSMTEVVTQAVTLGCSVVVWTLDGDWIDMGTPSSLDRARGVQ